MFVQLSLFLKLYCNCLICLIFIINENLKILQNLEKEIPIQNYLKINS